VTKDHAHHDRQGSHVISELETFDQTHKSHVTASHVTSDYAHIGCSANDVTSCHAQKCGTDHGQRGFPDHVTGDHVAIGRVHHSERDHVTLDHVTTDHAPKDHVTKEPVHSKHVNKPSTEQPDASAHVRFTESEVVMQKSYS